MFRMSRNIKVDEIPSDQELIADLDRQFKECIEKEGGPFSNEKMMERFWLCKHFLDESRRILSRRLEAAQKK